VTLGFRARGRRQTRGIFKAGSGTEGVPASGHAEGGVRAVCHRPFRLENRYGIELIIINLELQEKTIMDYFTKVLGVVCLEALALQQFSF
jgi:hypothetical protein